MTANPLHTPGEIFDLGLMNPNPTSSKTKAGPVYRISFEVERETWDLFMEAETSGLLLAAKACVVDETQGAATDAPRRPEKGPYGEAASILRIAGTHRATAVLEALGGDQAYQQWLRAQPCACKTWDPSAPQHAGDVVVAHVRRIAAGAGTGHKPEYSAIPLCDACHHRQHQYGESAIGGREAIDKLAAQHLERWAWAALAHAAGEESMTWVEPSRLCAWFESVGLRWVVPDGYRTWRTQ